MRLECCCCAALPRCWDKVQLVCGMTLDCPQENRPELIKQVLSTASRHGQTKEQRLVDRGDYDYRTPLHVAAAEGTQSCVECLLDADADPNPKDRWGHTPLFDAANNQHIS